MHLYWHQNSNHVSHCICQYRLKSWLLPALRLISQSQFFRATPLDDQFSMSSCFIQNILTGAK
jgi:hypothetical protein